MTDTRLAVLHADPIWAAYGLADLQPEMARFCTWTVSCDEKGLALLFTGLEPPVLLTVGTAEGVAAALVRMPKPASVYLSVREEHLPAVRRYYDESYDESGDHRPMWRMALVQKDRLVSPKVGDGRLIRLGLADGERIERLYAHGGDFAPDAFDPSQLTAGFFFGVEGDVEEDVEGDVKEESELIAVGGTHVVYAEESVAAIGNIYTHPNHRGKGYGQAVTAAITQSLVQSGYQTIVLNVDQRNEAARFLYDKLGFAIHCPFVEGIAKKKE